MRLCAVTMTATLRIRFPAGPWEALACLLVLLRYKLLRERSFIFPAQHW